MENLPIEMKNGYLLIKDIVDETLTKSGLYVPNDKYNRFARVLKTPENSKFNPGDVIIKPIGRTTPIKIDGVVYDSINENLIFAKIIDDEN